MRNGNLYHILNMLSTFNCRLLVLNLKLAIRNMYKYSLSRKVSLPGDELGNSETDSTSVPSTFSKALDMTLKDVLVQLSSVLAHIEDLKDINARVRKTDLPLVYHEAQPTVSSSNDF